MPKNLMDKMKEGVSVQDMEDFARKYTTEVFSVLAIVIGTISSMYDFFTGAKLTLLLLTAGVMVGTFVPAPVEKWLKQYYSFAHKQEKTSQMVLGCVLIVIALFIPFVLFGFVGLLAGTSYHYYTRHAQIMSETKPHKSHRSGSDEHD
jgi:hypothetical protein